MHFHDGIAHDHTHDHHHSHDDVKAFDSQEQAEALVSYMLEHNEQHTEELHEVSHKLEAGGKIAAAALLDKAIDEYRKGNAALADALEALKAGK